MRLFCALALCAPLVLGASARASAKVLVDRVVAVVNDDIVLESEVELQLAPQLQRIPDLDTDEAKKEWASMKRKSLDALIESKLVGQQAVELKLTVTSEEVDRALDEVKRQNKLDDATFVEALKQQGFTIENYKKSLKKQILELKVLNTAVRSRVQVSDDEVKTFYQQNARQLNGQTSAHLRQILVAVPPDANEAEVERLRKKAARVTEDARASGGKNFAELAGKFSDDDLTKGEGGDLGEVQPGVLQDALDQAVAGMEPGDVRGPIRTGRGWHILQLVERKAAPLRPLDEIKDQIRKQLYDQQVEKASQAWIKELRKKAHIDIRL